MAKEEPKPLTDERVMAFVDVVKFIVGIDEKCEDEKDYDRKLALLNQLYSSVTPEEFYYFVEIIVDADNPECRGSK